MQYGTNAKTHLGQRRPRKPHSIRWRFQAGERQQSQANLKVDFGDALDKRALIVEVIENKNIKRAFKNVLFF